MIALAAITVLLATRKDKDQPDWPSLLNINSLSSILTTVFRAALLFPVAEGIGELKWIHFSTPQPLRDIDRWDAASRGPWGALRLALKRPGNLLTLLGTCIIVLSIAINPFAQQVLNFNTPRKMEKIASLNLPRC